LKNIATGTVLLYDPSHPENTWKFTRGIDFAFPTSTTIPSDGYILVVRGDPETFRTTYGIPPSVDIFQYAGALDNEGEKVRLCKPGDPEPGTGFVPDIRVDQVAYDRMEMEIRSRK